METMKQIPIAGVILWMSAGAAMAQGVPVIDLSSIAQQIQQLEQMRSQLTALNQQISQSQQMFASVNQLTNMGDIATALNNPAIRRALPADFASVEKALMGTGTGAFGTNADAQRSANEVYTRPGDDFYASEVKRTQGANAGAVSVGQGMYEAASARIDGLEQLRQQIGQADSAAAKADLGNRIAVETAMLNTDMLRMQAVAMVQKAQIQVQEQRAKERYDQLVDDGIQSLGGGAPGSSPTQ
jgi:type IV secretion system protein VirB5